MTEVFLPENSKLLDVVPHAFEHEGYIIEIQKTIFGGRRVCIREGDDPGMFYLANWCAGAEQEHCQKLVGLAIALIEREMPKFPAESRIKPYFNDPDFCEKMERVGSKPFLFQFK